MASIGDIAVNLDDGIWRARAPNPEGYIKNARFCSLQIENEDGKALVTLYFGRKHLEMVTAIADLLNEIADTGQDTK